MILYYFPGACSLAVHIALIETEASYQLVALQRGKRTADRRDFLKINPKGCVPTLELDDGTVLTEALAILAYIAHQAGTLPEEGLPRWRALEALAFMTSEIHSNFKPFFYPDATQPEKDRARQKLVKHFAIIDQQLGDQPFLLGAAQTLPDAYLFVMLRWAADKGIEVSGRLGGYLARMTKIPSVARALAEEGLTSP